MATILVQDGTLRVGDTFIAGPIVGRVRALIDDRGKPIKMAPPSTPVEVLGLTGLPQPGDAFQALADAAKARQIATYRQGMAKEKALGAKGSRLTLESLQQQIAEGGMKDLPIVIKADVQGSAEVLADTLSKLSDERVRIKIIHSGVGAINESDVLLASASNAIIIGFNVRARSQRGGQLAEREEVDIRHHTVIYNVTDEMKKAMSGHARAHAEGSAARRGRSARTSSRFQRQARLQAVMSSTAASRAAAIRRRGSSATAPSCTRARSARCAVSRTM